MSLSLIDDDTVHLKHVLNFPSKILRRWCFDSFRRIWSSENLVCIGEKWKTRVCHMLQAHGATIVIQPASHPSHHTMNYFYNFKYGKLFCVLLWSKLLANRMNDDGTKNTSGETSKENYEWNIWRTFVARLCFEPFDSENCRLSRGKLYSLAVMENKLFVMTFECLQFISFRVLLFSSILCLDFRFMMSMRNLAGDVHSHHQ